MGSKIYRGIFRAILENQKIKWKNINNVKV
jgi:hypothetical protein